MSMTISYIIVSVACIVILQCVWKTMNKFWFRPRKLEKHLRQQGLVGNTYKFFYGDHKENFKITKQVKEKPISFTNDYYAHVFPYFHHLAQKYGENFFSWIGPTPVINISDPELISDALSRMHEFQKIDTSPLVDFLFCGVVKYEGDKWDMHRRLLNPAFHLKNLKIMLPAFHTSATELVNEWDNLLSRTSSCEIDVCPYFTTMTADVISRVAFGSTYEEGKRIFELITKLQEAVAPIIYSFYIPGWKYVPTKKNKSIINSNVEIENLLKKMVNKRKKAIKDGEGNNDDMFGILIESTLKKGTQQSINFQDLLDECKLFFFVGHETTSMFLSWTMLLLSKHQDWQARAREEVLSTFGMNPPDFDGLHRLKIMKMILNEVLRLYPPAPSFNRAIRSGDTTLGNLHIPEGVMIALSIIQAHHNPKFWGDDVKEFKPERFSDGIGKATNGNMSFFPFGWGPRFCMGQNLSLLEAKIALTIILQRFAFELSPSYIHAPTGVITLKPTYGAQIILRRA